MNILLLLAHSIEEHDQVKLLTELGYKVLSLGGYINPGAPHDPKRPALPNAPYYPELQAAVDSLYTEDNLEAAKRRIPDELLDWADTIICHHCEAHWLIPQWDRIKHKRVIWRTVGQSVENNERQMAPLRAEGLQVVRYSPKEKNIPGYIGEDALIRFYKDPDEWHGWTGETKQVMNVTQNFKQRDPYTNWRFWNEATRDLPSKVYGPGSEIIQGAGEVSLETMQSALRTNRAYLYTGTQPASYTLGLVEAMMTGIPVVSIGPAWMEVFPYGSQLFEGHEIVVQTRWSNSPRFVHNMLDTILNDQALAQFQSQCQRNHAIGLFGKDKIGAEWKEFLDGGA